MKKTWSRKKVIDKFTGMLKADGTPMSRQQIHMLRKKARGICMICSEPAVGVYCLKHTIAVRERMRKKLKYRRRLLNSPSYTAKAGNGKFKKTARILVKKTVKPTLRSKMRSRVKFRSKVQPKARNKARIVKKAATKAQKKR